MTHDAAHWEPPHAHPAKSVQQPPYGQAPDPYPYLPPPPLPTAASATWPAIPPPVTQLPRNSWAVASLALGVAGMLLAWVLGGIPSFLAIAFGHTAVAQTRKNPWQRGRGMAVAGLVLGYLSITFWGLVLVFSVVGAMAA